MEEEKKESIKKVLNITDDKIKNYKFLIINLENNDIEIVKSPRNISEILNEKYSIKISHMFFYRFFEKENYTIKENILIKKLIW
jgi:hypothetical protein